MVIKIKKNIGLALGGGAVLGAAHVGVLRAIDEYNIRINFITGTSIGAFVAALFAFGKTWKEIESIALELKWMDISSVTLSKYALLSNEKLGELLIKHIGNKNIEDAEIPLAFIATDISNGEKVVLNKGNIAIAVMASACIPGIFKPVEMDGRMLVDGGIAENIPVKTVREMGAKFIIGVDLNAMHTYQKPNNILDIILNSFHFLIQKTDKFQTKKANILLQPDLSKYSGSDTKNVQELMQKGYEEATESLRNRFLKNQLKNKNS